MIMQVQSHVIRIAWALAVLKEWEHPLFRMALNVLSIAQQTTAHSTARTPQTSVASQDNSSLGESAGVDLDFDSEGSESSMAVEAGIEETKDEMQLNKSSSDTADNSERSADELSRSGASFRGATGHDRKMPLRRLPAFSVLQLVQCMLLASAGGKTELLAMLPEGLRVSCGGAWKSVYPLFHFCYLENCWLSLLCLCDALILCTGCVQSEHPVLHVYRSCGEAVSGAPGH